MQMVFFARARASLVWPLDYAIGGALALGSFVLLSARYWFPNEKIFDEIYFARAAEEYLQRRYIYENTHPPLTKLLITLSTVLFGGLHGGDDSYGWRFLNVVFGALAVWMLFVLAKALTESTVIAGYAAVLFVFDGMHFAQSRIATPESFVAVFSLASVYALYRLWMAARDAPPGSSDGRLSLRRGAAAAASIALAVAVTALRFAHETLAAQCVAVAILAAGLYCVYRLFVERLARWSPGPARRVLRWSVLFGLAFAALVTSKWYGVMLIGVALIVVLGPDRRRFPLDLVVALIVGIGGAVYFAEYVPQFVGLADLPGSLPRAYTLSDVVDMQRVAFLYHAHLTQGHPYASRWWQWPLDLRPMLYYAEYGRGDGGVPVTATMIYSLPNPLILWPGLLTVPYIGYLAWRERRANYAIVVLAYLMQWLPWVGSPRISFSYHFYVDVPLICLCTAMALERLWRWANGVGGEAPSWVRAAGIAYVAAVVLAFVYFYPVLAGVTIPYEAWQQRMWLRSWI